MKTQEENAEPSAMSHTHVHKTTKTQKDKTTKGNNKEQQRNPTTK